MKTYTVRVIGRGEEVEYAEDDERMLFEISFSKVPYHLYARQFWSYPLPTGPFRLPKGKEYVVERIAAWMSRDGVPTQVIWKEKAYRTPLKSVDELLAERIAKRDNNEK